jgi:outer membrane protein assembly factor BamA
MGGAFGSSFKAFGRSEKGDFRLQGLNADYGFGIRASLGFLPLKFDWAWRTDLDKTEPHVQYNFSIAPEF